MNAECSDNRKKTADGCEPYKLFLNKHGELVSVQQTTLQIPDKKWKMAEGPFDRRAGLYEVGMGQQVNDRYLL